MNIVECRLVEYLYNKHYSNQRDISINLGYSLGLINKSIRNLTTKGILDKDKVLSSKTVDFIVSNKPKRAIILAAGTGMRMIPLNAQYSKGLLKVNGEVLIERTIRFLHEIGIFEIYIVVGFMKELYEYLIDEYGVRLIINMEYSIKNNLKSLELASDYLESCYIIPCDIWFKKNPFNNVELYSWYMITNSMDKDSSIRVNKKMELIRTSDRIKGNTMVGLAYITQKDAKIIKSRLNAYSKISKYDNLFWEEVLFNKSKMLPYARIASASDYVEINTYEQYRYLNKKFDDIKIHAIEVIKNTLKVDSKDIVNIESLKKGMTNRSFLFDCKNKKYIMRIPGEGTNKLINRYHEAEVYSTIDGRDLCENILYMDPNNGYKISEYLINARVCDCKCDDDVKKCMKKLREFHELKLTVSHEFDLFKYIDFYQSLWSDNNSIYKDYQITKNNIYSLKDYINKYCKEKVLTHIDAVCDNFLFVKNSEGIENIYLIDWEYAGMQDPHVDIAMFAIYALYDKEKIDKLIDYYFFEGCSKEIRLKIYCYIATCGLLWSNWCEYKRQKGVEFGEYALRQYRYAKDYYRIVQNELIKGDE